MKVYTAHGFHYNIHDTQYVHFWDFAEKHAHLDIANIFDSSLWMDWFFRKREREIYHNK